MQSLMARRSAVRAHAPIHTRCLPRRLPAGGTIGIAAPAGVVDPERLAAGEASLRAAGFEIRRRDDLLARDDYLAGNDARRAAELMELVDDPSVHAIVCARGGFGSLRMVSRLDAGRVRAARKPLVGYSDATTLLLWQLRCAGLVGFHGPMLERDGGMDPQGLGVLVELLTRDASAPLVLQGDAGSGGRAEGTLVGGNLTTLMATMGTPWEIETEGAILVFEEVSEPPYRIDRMLHQLLAAGKLDGVVGIGVGHLVGCEPALSTSGSALDKVRAVGALLGVPLVTGLPTGHAAPNLPWPMGVRGVIDAERARIEVQDAVVEDMRS
jgi:muramoyltetrapeptide carboxypeptidase